MRSLPTNDLIKEILGDNHPRPLGWQLLVQTYNFGEKYVNQDGSQSVFDRPDSAKDRDRFQVGVGKVLMLGSAAFKGQKFELWDLIPIVGDYVSFPKYQGTYQSHNYNDIITLEDISVITIVPDPSLSGYLNFRGN